MSKHVAYMWYAGGVFGIKRGQRTDEYGSGGRIITPSSRARIWDLLEKCESVPYNTEYRSMLGNLYVYVPLDRIK